MPLTQETAQAVIEFCNQVRAQFGVGPVEAIQPGRTTDHQFCPVAQTLLFEQDVFEVSVFIDDIKVRDDKRVTWLNCRTIFPTPIVQAFIRAFDRGDYPELLKEGE